MCARILSILLVVCACVSAAHVHAAEPPVAHAHQTSPDSEFSTIVPATYERLEHPRQLFAEFDDGFAVRTEDDEFELKIRVMQQTDAKLFLPRAQRPARPGLYIPRFRAYFEGHITESYEYELSLARSIEGAFDVLDASLNFKPSEEFQLKFGRFLVPFSYDWFDHLEQFFITPERALFPLNFGLSREAGLMAWGKLNEDKLEYALGAFSGQLTGLADTNTTRDVVGYLNSKPFLDDSTSPFQHLNLGGSFSFGQQAFASETLPLRTSIQSSENDEAANAASSVFLEFEEGVEFFGPRSTAALHLALYHEQLSFESEIQYGNFHYKTHDGRTPNIEALGYHFVMSYFITGEEVTDRSIVIPNSPFNPGGGNVGTGAIEPYFRFSYLELDEAVFTEELSNPDNWARKVSMVDLGWNWYPNRYVKLYFDWQTAFFNSPVLIDLDPQRRVKKSHTLWARAQLFF